jgi:signal transduction histidine kinase/ActR/RegA family two-component response regulator
MSENPAAKRLVDLIPAIMQRWDDRVRAEVSPAAGSTEIVLRDSIAEMLAVMAKVLGDKTDPRTAARDLAYLTIHGKERANQTTYSLEELILEFHILQEVVLEAVEPDHLLDTRDRGVVIQYVNEMVRVAAGEFVRVQQTLQAYADRLAQTDRSKDEFLAMLSHELRNPLGAISTALFLLQEGPANPATQKGALEVATRQARHMKQMLDDLLDLARINEGRITLQRTRVDLGTEIQQALEVAQPVFALRKHAVSMSLPAERIYVMADPVRLGQCFSNLFTNAAKYTNLGGRIDVSLARDDDGAVVRVRDNGVGIPRDLLPNVFDLGRQAPRGPDRAGGGLGLGLTIVRRLIELHEGRVEAKSEGAGMGSEFVVRLPVMDAVQDILPAPQRPHPTAAGLKVLLVEDSPDAAEMMAGALEMLGCHVAVAHDAPAALAAVATDCPDVGLLDIGLPGMSGYELAAKLRAGGFCPPSLKLVALTGYAKDPEALAAAGFDGHLAKPVDFDQLGETLANFIAARREPPRA